MIVPLVIATLFLSDGIIRLIGGAGFIESAEVLRILIFSLVFIFFGSFFNAVMIAANLQKKLMYILGTAAAANVLLNLVLIPRFSYLGAAYVAVFTEFFVATIVAYFVIRNIGYFPRIENAARLLFAGILMAVFLFVFRNFNFFILAMGSASIYALSLWLFKVITTEEIKSLISKKGVSEFEPL